MATKVAILIKGHHVHFRTFIGSFSQKRKKVLSKIQLHFDPLLSGICEPGALAKRRRVICCLAITSVRKLWKVSFSVDERKQVALLHWWGWLVRQVEIKLPWLNSTKIYVICDLFFQKFCIQAWFI